MKRLIRYLALGAGVGFVTLVLSVTSARPTVAQLAQPTHQAILDAINSLRNSIDSTLSGIQTSLNTLVAEGQTNVRVTPPLSGYPSCTVLNVSDTARTITSKLVFVTPAANSNIVQTNTATLAPGKASELRSTLGGIYYCTFTVDGGSKADIRGSLTTNQGTTTTGITSVSAE